jgi:hypothetical protein
MLLHVVRLTWLLSCLLLLATWVVQLPLNTLGYALPFSTMLLSFRVFNPSPRPFRLFHHAFVSSLFLLTLTAVLYYLLYAPAHGTLSILLLLFGVSVGYLVFISFFVIFLKLYSYTQSS